jgi:hypothetical protein
LNAIEAEAREDRIDALSVHGDETGGFLVGGPRLNELRRSDIDLSKERAWEEPTGGADSGRALGRL